MLDTTRARPLGLIRELNVIIGGHTFQISIVVLKTKMAEVGLSRDICNIIYKIIRNRNIFIEEATTGNIKGP